MKIIHFFSENILSYSKKNLFLALTIPTNAYILRKIGFESKTINYEPIYTNSLKMYIA